MNNDINLSVIINSYNYVHFIEDAIVSALQQTLPRSCYEIIVVDDGSTDETRQLVEKYLPDVIYHYKQNGGQASAINAGLDLARGELVAFLDADDYWHEEKLSQILNIFRGDTSVDVVYHALRLVDDADKWRGVIPAANKSMSCQPFHENISAMYSLGGAMSGISWRTAALKRLLPVPEEYRICADAYLMICAPLVARKIVFLDKPLGFYRIHGNNSFSELSPTLSAVYPKSENVASFYRKMCLNDLVRLSVDMGHSRVGMVTELNAICLADELVAVRNNSGVFKAFCQLWRSRRVFAGLPVKQRAFRTVTTTLKLIVSQQTFVVIQARCVNSPLWHLVQRYIKGANRYVLLLP